ncbi:UvrD-helicase domain-containing protein [Massilia sp. CCM 8734]|uniref:UvrD-helicase domain-containing protein n=1 Tax=Massilia sp. CCM 8734 TaxID=2609283 RepID=UPI001422973B|nr:UvrD-helicase domain-containing protein [Massilia sp. CCM 8734]NIA00915.1 AAA family ATPase [Massilia sp. CCM 8734]
MSAVNEDQGVDIDAPADAEITNCLNLASLRSFFLFAGAGSGKTRSLVNALVHVQKNFGDTLRMRGQRVGVITFTNAASDEIKRRLNFDPLIDVSTIHSFAWSLIDGLNNDIREWLRVELADDIVQLNVDEAKGRQGTKASVTRLGKIVSKTKRLGNLNNITRFVYSPTGDNHGRDALNHSEVLQLTSHFLNCKPTMQSILVGRYPILLIDESQDTNKHLIDALFAVQKEQKQRFALGLLGDMMQRIYNDGKEGLGRDLPADWATPGKKLNHRCPKRVVTLINKVRSTADTQQQQSRIDAVEGTVRFFILPSDTPEKSKVEQAIANHMAELTEDQSWREQKSYKSLTLEHRMAASRMGFLDMFAPLYSVESWRTSFLDGKLPISRFFTEEVLPLVTAKAAGDNFTVTRLMKACSPLLTPDALRNAGDTKAHLKNVSMAMDTLMKLWDAGGNPSLLDVLRCIEAHNLLDVPEVLKAHALMSQAPSERDVEEEVMLDSSEDERDVAVTAFLAAPFTQVEPFATYMSGVAHFDTHQGVKGLEFERVMVIMDDEEARGFSFKYGDLFGGKSTGDKTVESTRRLFYVTCSRACKSLALVAYSTAPQRIYDFVIAEGWFAPDEIVQKV